MSLQQRTLSSIALSIIIVPRGLHGLRAFELLLKVVGETRPVKMATFRIILDETVDGPPPNLFISAICEHR
jgi:hypothetical protein